jgi:hypothetical protein
MDGPAFFLPSAAKKFLALDLRNNVRCADPDLTEQRQPIDSHLPAWLLALIPDFQASH